MKLLPLILANLLRKKTRTILTLLSLVMAFMLFGLLQGVNVLFNSGAELVGTQRLITQARVSFTNPLPLSQLSRIESTDGVKNVAWMQWFGAYYQEPKNFLAEFAIPPDRYFDIYPEWVVTPEHMEAFRSTRTGILVGAKTMERFGWSVGDRIPLTSTIWPQKDGNRTWEFDIVGTYTGRDEDWAGRAQGVFLQFDYFDEARQFGNGNAGFYVVEMENPDQAEAVIEAIDSAFLNSPNETKTQSEAEWNLNFVRQIGDIGLIVNSILIAVFFTILLVTGNTMSQAVRERIPELAVLKILGFTDNTVTATVLAEALVLCAIGAGIGMGLAVIGAGALSSIMNNPVPVDGQVWSMAAAAVLALALAVGIGPALRARRLIIVDALAGR